MSSGSDILLQTKGLTIGYGKGENHLMVDLNLELRAGEMVCFMGSNGIGKSTLIRTLAGLQTPLSGSVTLPKLASKSGANDIAIVLTEKVSAVSMSVEELVAFGRYPFLDWNIRLSDDDKIIISNAISQVGITHLSQKKLYELSDGQLQMAMIARAIAQDTPIILLDEPTAHLDLNNRIEIMRLLGKLARTTNKAILLATHELDLALRTADLIWLAGTDQNVVSGVPEDLVLSGIFDDVFQFKGFDLRTGVVDHEAYRNKTFVLVGEGSEYLWTKNALERNGFAVSTSGDFPAVGIANENGVTSWIFDHQRYSKIKDLLDHLSR